MQSLFRDLLVLKFKTILINGITAILHLPLEWFEFSPVAKFV